MKRISSVYNSVREIYDELAYKVSWPSKSELYNSTVVVMVASFIMAMVMFVIDFSFENLMGFFYKNIFK